MVYDVAYFLKDFIYIVCPIILSLLLILQISTNCGDHTYIDLIVKITIFILFSIMAAIVFIFAFWIVLIIIWI